jgi:hypothetical protein
MTSTYLPLYDVWNLSSSRLNYAVSSDASCHSICDASNLCIGYAWDENQCHIVKTFPLPTSGKYTDISATYFHVKDRFSDIMNYLDGIDSRYEVWKNNITQKNFSLLPSLIQERWKKSNFTDVYIDLHLKKKELEENRSQEIVESDQTDLFQIYYQYVLFLVIALFLLALLAYNSTTSTIYYVGLYIIAIFSMFTLT